MVTAFLVLIGSLLCSVLKIDWDKVFLVVVLIMNIYANHNTSMTIVPIYGLFLISFSKFELIMLPTIYTYCFLLQESSKGHIFSIPRER